jgi:hypothetical protein
MNICIRQPLALTLWLLLPLPLPLALLLVLVQIPYQVDILRASMDNETIGSIICKRAENMQAGIVVLAKHTRGAIKEFFVGSVTK